MKTTAFTKYHIAAGAKMAEFAGYNMPIEFTGINDEHMAVRNGAGVFDVSHMGEIWVKGPKALDLLQRITTNDVSKLFDGKVQYSCMPNGHGGIVDDILVYRVDAETYMLCVNAANIEKDWNHICEQGRALGMEAGHGKELYNASDEICQLAVQGPLAMKVVQKMCAEPVEDMEYYTFKKMKVAGCDAILSITGYTGSGGCEIYVANEDGDKLWKALWEAGGEYGLKNIGLGARDTLRLEKGFCLYGNDIHRPGADGKTKGRGGYAQARRVPDDRPRNPAPRLQDRRGRWRGDRPCYVGYDVALPEGRLRFGLREARICQTGHGGRRRHPRETPARRGGEDPVRLTCPAGLHSGPPGSGMF